MQKIFAQMNIINIWSKETSFWKCNANKLDLRTKISKANFFNAFNFFFV